MFCGIDDDPSRVDAAKAALEKTFEPGGRDAVTGEPMRAIFAEAAIESFEGHGHSGVRASLVEAPGRDPGELFGAFDRGSMVTWIGSSATPSPGRPAMTREANLLGSFSLAVADRMLEACHEEAGLGRSGRRAGLDCDVSRGRDGRGAEQGARAHPFGDGAASRQARGKGDVERRPGGDRRSLSVVATDQGAAKAARIRSARAEALETMLMQLTAAERSRLASLHAKLLGGVVDSGARPANVCRLCDAEGCGHYEGHCPVTQAADRHR